MSEMLALDELRDVVGSMLADRFGETVAIPGDEGRGLDVGLWREMAALGWLGLAVPEAQGGLGLGLGHVAVLYEELGRHVASVPLLPTMMAAQVLATQGALADRWLPGIVAGDDLAAVALPGDADLPGFDADGRLQGIVDHVLFADVATLLLLPVETPYGVALALLTPDMPGVRIEKRPMVDLTRSMARVSLDGVALSAEALLPLDAAAWNALADHAATGIACDAMGGAAALLDRTIDYLKIREQFGRPIGSFQALKVRAADWKVKIDAATALARHAAALLAAGDAGATASEARAYAGDLYAAFAGDAVQLHGGIGFTWEHPCHLFLKRAKLGQQLFGSPAAHRDRAARLAFEPTAHD